MMIGKSAFWFSLILIPRCIIGQQKDSIPTSWVYENGKYLELQISDFHWDNPDLSTLHSNDLQEVNWTQLLQYQNSLLHKMWRSIDSLQQQQIWQSQVYEQQIKQIEVQVDELQRKIIALQNYSGGPSMASIENPFLWEYNLPTEIPIYFAHQVASIELEALMALNEIIELLTKEPTSAVLISGFANDYNLATENILLSQRRVEEVRNMLITSGISSERIITRYMGHLYDDGKGNFQKVIINFIQKP